MSQLQRLFLTSSPFTKHVDMLLLHQVKAGDIVAALPRFPSAPPAATVASTKSPSKQAQIKKRLKPSKSQQAFICED